MLVNAKNTAPAQLRPLPLEWALISVLAVAIFVPPLSFSSAPLAGKKIYVYDLIMLAWGLVATPALGLAAWRRAGRLPPGIVWASGFLLAMTAAFLHGMLRPDLRDALLMVFSRSTDGSHFGPFEPVNDTIQYTRFLSWGLGWYGVYLLINCFQKAKPRMLVLGDALGLTAATQAGLAALFFFSPLRRGAGALYGYDPDYFAWKSRFYGTMASPMELGALMCVGTLWWAWRWRFARQELGLLALLSGNGGLSKAHGLFQPMARHTARLTAALLVLCTLGLLGANTATWILSTFLGTCWLFRGSLYKRPWLLVPPVVLFVLLSYIIVSKTGFEWAARYPWFAAINIENKFENLLFRLGPWGIYMHTVFSNWHNALFGLGFGRGHSDSSYVHLLRMGGLSLFVYALALVGRGYWLAWLRHSSQIDTVATATATSLTIALCFLLTALTNDCLFMRVPALLFGYLWVGCLQDGPYSHRRTGL